MTDEQKVTKLLSIVDSIIELMEANTDLKQDVLISNIDSMVKVIRKAKQDKNFTVGKMHMNMKFKS